LIEDGNSEARGSDGPRQPATRRQPSPAATPAKGLGLQDLIEEGNLGLLRAVEGFDHRMNTRFSTYASYWIKQSIKRALVNTAKTIRIRGTLWSCWPKWRRAAPSCR